MFAQLLPPLTGVLALGATMIAGSALAQTADTDNQWLGAYPVTLTSFHIVSQPTTTVAQTISDDVRLFDQFDAEATLSVADLATIDAEIAARFAYRSGLPQPARSRTKVYSKAEKNKQYVDNRRSQNRREAVNASIKGTLERAAGR